MQTRVLVFAAILTLGCASAERETAVDTRTADQTAGEAAEGGVLTMVEVQNTSGIPVTLTARVGTSAEQELGVLAPGESYTYRIPTGAAASNELVLRARGQDGREATTTLQVTGQTLSWEIPSIP